MEKHENNLGCLITAKSTQLNIVVTVTVCARNLSTLCGHYGAKMRATDTQLQAERTRK